MRIAICTLGCKVNQYEAQAIERELLRRGHTLTPFEEEADAYIINTCSVTAVSDKKSRQMIRRAKSRGAVVAVCGCYAQTHPDDVKALGVDVLAGTNSRSTFLDLVERAAADREPIVSLDDPMQRRCFEALPAGRLAGRTRAMLKIEDGCANFCSYCLIPYARGSVRSLPLSQALSEVRNLRGEGCLEVVITGIEISSYGQDMEEQIELIDLVEQVCREVPELRVRLGSMEPRTITRSFCERAAQLSNLCPHFHLSLQSGCDRTLRRMNRRYDTERYLESCRLLREAFDHPAITTDLITGFPGESEDEFSETLSFIEQCAFAGMHIFPYSIRPGTRAAEMPQVDKAIRTERAARASALAAKMKAAYLDGCVGRLYLVLFESGADGSVGHAPNYAEVRVDLKGLQSRLLPVRIVSSDGRQLCGIVEET